MNYTPEEIAAFMRSIEQLPGNDDRYLVTEEMKKDNPVICGRHIIFLGSSVTFGAMSLEQSFVECLAAMDGVIPYKEAVSGTTLVNTEQDGSSYVERMLTIPREWKADAFICQLSTNDATQGKKMGSVSEKSDLNAFDCSTIAGAMEFIIAFSRKTWHCPIIFYTGTKYDSPQYQQMVDLLREIQKKWEIGVIDLWNDPDMLAVSPEDYALYMADGIHPTRAGYLCWWTPKFETFLTAFLK